jgi:hypothetical protein
MEKYVVAAKQWALGFLKETLYQGNVITVDREANQIVVDGRALKDIRDIDIAKRQAEKFPHNPLIVPFTEENLRKYKEAGAVAPMSLKKNKVGKELEVVRADEDLHDTIDISSTQISKRKREAEDASKVRGKNEKLPVITGDESSQERLERLREIKASEKIPIIRDDSLGVEGGSKSVALNAGQKLPSRQEVESRESIARQQADIRKKAAEAKRGDVIADAESPSEIQTLLNDADKKPVIPVVNPRVKVADVKPPLELRIDGLEKRIDGLNDTLSKLNGFVTKLMDEFNKAKDLGAKIDSLFEKPSVKKMAKKKNKEEVVVKKARKVRKV